MSRLYGRAVWEDGGVRARARILAAGDAVALVLFAVIGLLSHDKGITGNGLVRDAVPVLGGWFAAALALGVYRASGWGRFLAAWAIGVTAGVLVRGFVLHRHVLGARYLTFLAVTLVVTLVLLSACRALARAAMRPRATRVPD
jgi:hypothetical protein